MNTRPARPEYVEGWEAPIHRGLWQPILTLGVPRVYAGLWGVMNLGLALFFLSGLGPAWALAPFGTWLVGHATLSLLTKWDPHWDRFAWSGVLRTYKPYYDVGGSGRRSRAVTTVPPALAVLGMVALGVTNASVFQWALTRHSFSLLYRLSLIWGAATLLGGLSLMLRTGKES